MKEKGSGLPGIKSAFLLDGIMETNVDLIALFRRPYFVCDSLEECCGTKPIPLYSFEPFTGEIVNHVTGRCNAIYAFSQPHCDSPMH